MIRRPPRSTLSSSSAASDVYKRQLRNLETLLAHNMRLSGTVPDFAPALPSYDLPSAATLLVERGACVLHSNNSCVTSPDYPANYRYSTQANCTIRVLTRGYVTSSVFKTELGDFILRVPTLSGVAGSYSGVVGPQSEHVQAGTRITFSTSRTRRRGDVPLRPTNKPDEYGWDLCWHSTAVPKLHTVSLSRNFLTGGIDPLRGALSLRTLNMASNYLSCVAADMDEVTKLGTGRFVGPSNSALFLAGSDMATTGAAVNPFSSVPLVTYRNLVENYPGNPMLVSNAGLLADVGAGRLLREDAVREGKRELLPGYSGFGVLLWILLPGLLLLHITVVLVLTRTHNEPVLGYLRRTLPRGEGATRAKLLSIPFRGLCALAVCGVVLVILAVASPNIYQDGCSDPLLRCTTANTTAGPLYQWLWVLFTCSGMGCYFVFRNRLRELHIGQRAESVHACLLSMGSPLQNAVASWRGKVHTPHRDGWPWRRIVSHLLHIPLLLVSSIPAVGFVLSQNVPTGSSFVLELLGNSVIIAMIKMLWSELLLPPVAERLARFRHGLCRSSIPPHLAISLQKTQVGTSLLAECFSVLVAPMLAVFVLDETCLRGYLSFNTQLYELLDSWELAQQGWEAYRPGFCSRLLLSTFSYVWLTIALISGLFSPCVDLIQLLPWVRRLLDRFVKTDTAEDAEYCAAMKIALAEQTKLVQTLTLLLTVEIFGPVVPPLMLLAPSVSWLQLCASDAVHRHASRASWSALLASNVLVQAPMSMYRRIGRVGSWTVAAVVFADLEFGVGPIVCYGLFMTAEVLVSWWFSRRAAMEEDTEDTGSEVNPMTELRIHVNEVKVDLGPSEELEQDVVLKVEPAPVVLIKKPRRMGSSVRDVLSGAAAGLLTKEQARALRRLKASEGPSKPKLTAEQTKALRHRGDGGVVSPRGKCTGDLSPRCKMLTSEQCRALERKKQHEKSEELASPRRERATSKGHRKIHFKPDPTEEGDTVDAVLEM
eukprot:TRINITY_DN10255_c0_g1_i1.p1 TRINITY_DN10255_c0_g1~~TRINITY_DN10255_c0_g1_i1.p1  ORF type:complete len:994 (-),score=211.74 TRINITY_DN10255_c0_g1_i1:784-3765(-)